MHDHPLPFRLQHLQAALTQPHLSAQHRALLTQSIKRLTRARKGAKYPNFYPLTPLIHLAFDPSSDRLDSGNRLLLKLRLTTMMRSADCGAIIWGVYQLNDDWYIQTTTKTGHLQAYTVQGSTLDDLLNYLYDHRQHPAIHLFRYQKVPGACLTPQRLAKRMLGVLQLAGIDTAVYKAHSLRGATATHLLKTGTPPTWVRTRGGWTSSATLDLYYSRTGRAS